jgi:hypothetical protein
MALVAPTAALKTFSAVSTVLFIKFFATVTIQGGKSFAAGARPPEDSGIAPAGMPKQTYGLSSEAEDGDSSSGADAALQQARAVDYRWKRIVQNDSVLVGGQEETNCALMGVFAAARVGHTFAYANEKQPHRALLWTLGQLCVLACALNGFISFLIA